MARKPEYCTNSGVESCNECSMVNYRRDCHNNPIAKDDPNYSWLGNVKSDAAEDIRWRATCKGNALQSISIVSRAVNEAIAHRAETLCRERGITMLDRCDGDWVGEFAETDNTMRTLHSVMTMLREARGKA